jgi:ABC-type amino acid transport substrate-binding protein
VGYFADAIPYAFHNPEGELVGYDVEMAHLLAREMRVGLEFVPIERATAPDSLRSGQCDIVMSGYLISVQRAERVEFSHSYLQERLGFLVEDHRRGQFRNLGALAGERLRIAVPNVEGTFDTLSRWLPNVEQVPISSYDEVVAKSHELDAILIPIERAQYWSRVHPELSAVLPEEDTGSALVAYGLPVGEVELRNLVNVWLDVQRAQGRLQQAYDYWVRGHAFRQQEPRWSIARNVLGWTE